MPSATSSPYMLNDAEDPWKFDTPVLQAESEQHTPQTTQSGFQFFRRIYQRGRRRKVVNFFHPFEPITHSISKPLLPRLTQLLSKLVPARFRLAYLVAYHVVFITALALFDHFGHRASSVTLANGQTTTPDNWSCYAALSSEKCGTFGIDCGPYPNATFTVRCPAGCNLARTLGPTYVGSTFVQGRPFVIGSDIYRGDSWVCASAVHAGVVSATAGGCVTFTQLQGQFNSFAGSERNGIKSETFASSYPVAYTFSPASATKTQFCTDPVLPSSIYFFLYMPLIVLGHPSIRHFVVSTAAYVFFFWILLSADAFTSDAKLATAWGLFMPYMAINLLMIPRVFQRALPSVGKYPVDIFVFLYLALVVALQNELIQSKLPAFTLTSSALTSPSRLALLLVLVLGFLALFGAQANCLRKEAKLLPFLAACALVAVILCVTAPLLSMSMHIHHYMVGALFMPSASTQTRLSLVFLGLMWGLYLQGISRWGFDTPFELQSSANRAIGLSLGSSIPTWVTASAGSSTTVPLSADNATALLKWQLFIPGPPAAVNVSDVSVADYTDRTGVTAFTLLMNDVEVYRGTQGAYNVSFDDTTQRRGQLPWTDPMAFRVVPVLGTMRLDPGPVISVWRNGTALVANVIQQT
ncbi:hypothetical protein RI367_006130 [Sorochytrium milnesiophthora]